MDPIPAKGAKAGSDHGEGEGVVDISIIDDPIADSPIADSPIADNPIADNPIDPLIR